jgi:hypothetical protein
MEGGPPMISSARTIDLSGVELIKPRDRRLNLTTSRNEKFVLDLASADFDVLEILKLAISQEQRARRERAALVRKLDQEAKNAAKKLESAE